MKPVAKFRDAFKFFSQNRSTQGAVESLSVVPKMLSHWFSVDEAKVAKILETVRQSLPTTEVLLIGKPQSGKSSIIRCLTGATPEIIGQGFRPHTTHTQTYLYPTAELPLLIFTDTVGLGEGIETFDLVTQELMSLANPAQSFLDEGPNEGLNEGPNPKVAPNGSETVAKINVAKIIVLTVKINDFATDYLLAMIGKIRAQYPTIPVLLVATCLHELYPPEQVDHLPYPPNVSDINRAFGMLKAQFSKVVDQFVLIDFTLETDGFTPIFYGIEAFVDRLSDLLPEAESQMIHQLLDQAEAGNAIESIYRQAGRRYILPFSIMAATLAAVPLPLATMPVLTSLQITMVSLLGRVYGQTLNLSQTGGVVSAIAGGFVAQAIGRELVKFIPIFGSVVAASWAGAYTWALGEGACVYFGDLMGGHKPDPDNIQRTMQTAFKSAKERFRQNVSTQRSTHDVTKGVG